MLLYPSFCNRPLIWEMYQIPVQLLEFIFSSLTLHFLHFTSQKLPPSSVHLTPFLWLPYTLQPSLIKIAAVVFISTTSAFPPYPVFSPSCPLPAEQHHLKTRSKTMTTICLQLILSHSSSFRTQVNISIYCNWSTQLHLTFPPRTPYIALPSYHTDVALCFPLMPCFIFHSIGICSHLRLIQKACHKGQTSLCI